MLKDIIEDGVVDKEKSYCVDANYFKGGNLIQYFEKRRRQLVFENKGVPVYEKPHGFNKGGIKEKLKFSTLRESTPHNYAICVGHADIKGKDILKRVYSAEGKSPTLTAVCGGHQEKKIEWKDGWRKLTPLECERLQTIPDNYSACVSNTQRYKMLGNGWTVDVIAHILKGIKDES